MTYGAGVSASLGFAAETTYGTVATPSRFLEFNSESMDFKKKIAQSLGLRAGGRMARSAKRAVVTTDASGDVNFDLPTKGLGLPLKWAMGTSPSPTTVASGVYSYSFTLGSTDGTSFTTQVAVPTLAGTQVGKTFTGCKVTSWDIAVPHEGLATMKLGIDAQDMNTSTAIATPSYAAASNVFHWGQGAITRNGTTIANVRDFTLAVENDVKTDRFNLGQAGKKSEQIIGGYRKGSVKATVEFTDSNFLSDYLADSNVALVFTLTGGIISSTYHESITITIPAARINTAPTNVTGPDIVMQSLDFEILDDGTNEPITILVQTSDAAL